MKHIVIVVVLLGLLLAVGLGAGMVAAQGPQPARDSQAALGTAFTYQGELKKNGTAVTTSCNLQFTLFADAGGTVTVAGPVSGSPDPVTPTNGRFTVQVDFGAGKFDGTGRWLRVAAKCAGDSAFTPMSALQPLTATPYALYSATAGSVNYQNVVVVAKSGGNYATITNALNSITTASDTNRFLVKVMPGVYAETLTMKSFVDIEGSGELTTKITQVGSASAETGTVVGANNAELRFLTVANTGGASYANAIYNVSASPRLTHITATASGGTYSCGVLNSASSSTMTNVTVTASGASDVNSAVVNGHSSPTMTDVIATASGTAGSNNYAVRNTASSPAMFNVTAAASGGTNSYGVNNFNSSPTMTNVTASASGGGTNRGLFNYTSSSPTMTNVTATASGTSGSANDAVNNSSSSSPTMTYLVASASGGSVNYGVFNESSSVTIQNSTMSASDGNSDGIVNDASSGSYTVKVNNSVISGGTSTIYSFTSNYTVTVGTSQLIGIGGQGNGIYKCIFTYNSSYNEVPSGCR